MPLADYRVLAINPGSTSTKFGLWEGDRQLQVWTSRHSGEDLAAFAGQPILAQEDWRCDLITEALSASNVDLASIDAFVGRGGLLRPMASGAYRVNAAMLEELRCAPRGEHASNLGAILAHRLARVFGAPAFVVDPVSVNERSETARISGSPAFERGPFCHALNSKAIAKRYARDVAKPYADLRLVVAHLGGGVCVSAHEGGKMIDVTDASEEGPFSPERSGSVPVRQLVDLCFSGTRTRDEIQRMLVGDGGLQGYLGTADLQEVERRMAAGDVHAALIFEALAYQVGKEIAAMAAALSGRVDALLVTGGMAFSNHLVAQVRDRVEWIAPVEVYPGEDELLALCEGAQRVLCGAETARELTDERDAEAEAPAAPYLSENGVMIALRARTRSSPDPTTMLQDRKAVGKW